MRWKTSWIACCMVAFIPFVNGQEWDRLSFVPPSSSLKSVFIATDYVIAVGETGTVVKSHDFGVTWRTLPITTKSLRRVRFSDDTSGFIVGDLGFVARTTDAGESWTEYQMPYGDVRDVWSLDGMQAIAVAEFGYIYRTTNGGESWQTMQVGSSRNDDLLAVDFVDESNGCAVGGFSQYEMPRILVTDNGGASWEIIETPFRGWLASVKFVNEGVVIAIGRTGTILRSEDTGRTWDSVFAFTNNSSSLREVSFVHDSVGCAVSNNGSVVTTVDRGLTWTVRENAGASLQGVELLPNGTGLAVGGRGIHTTHDFGQSWREPRTLAGGSVRAVEFIDDDNGWILVQENAVYNTTDGGLNWHMHRVPFAGNATEFALASADVAIVASDSAEMYRTSDGGVTWQQVNEGNQTPITDFHFINSDTGWACGYQGTILRTIDSGVNWWPQHSGGAVLNGIFAINGRHQWAVGASGVVMRNYGDEGWHIQTQFSTQHTFTDVFFIDEFSGVVVGSIGTTMRTSDAGELWRFSTPQQNVLTSVSFANYTDGWITGHDGILYLSSDGGVTWEHDFGFLGRDLFDIAVAETRIWIVGESGAVFKQEMFSNTGGNTSQVPQHFSLSAFPNPFNSTATLRFELPREARTEIILYDVLGRVALELTDEVYSAGTHSLTLDAASLASGVYFANLRAPDYSTTQKLLLIR